MQQPRGSAGYSGSYGWGQSQPLGLETVQEYIEAAYARRGLFRDIVEDFAKECGPNVVVIAPCVKSEVSAERKVWDRTSSAIGHPEAITDYLRARILVPSNPGSVAQLANAMNRFTEHPLTVAYKDRIFMPNGSAFRALNGQMKVDGMHAELQIIPDDKLGVTRTINGITEGLRTTERAIRDMEDNLTSSIGLTFNNLVTKSQKTIVLVREYRKALHDYAAEASGVNALMSANIIEAHTAPSKRELHKMYQTLARDYFGKRSKGLGPMQYLAANAPGHTLQ